MVRSEQLVPIENFEKQQKYILKTLQVKVQSKLQEKRNPSSEWNSTKKTSDNE